MMPKPQDIGGRHLSFPFRIAKDGGTTVQVSSLENHIRDEIMQLILTNPGERLFLPEFGGGVRRLIFHNADQTTAGMTKAAITQAISRWLGGRISIEDLRVWIENEKIDIEIKYRIAGSQDAKLMTFQRKGG
jgi:phage baseplate assembly protein W